MAPILFKVTNMSIAEPVRAPYVFPLNTWRQHLAVRHGPDGEEDDMPRFTRRDALAAGLGTIAITAAASQAAATPAEATEEIRKFTNGREAQTGRITLDLPEIAENGNMVPLTVSVQSAMSGDDFVEEILLVAAGNPRPGLAKFTFTEMSGAAEALTRIRLGETQDVIAVAKMRGGAFFTATRNVKVTIGGCGG